MRYVRFDSRKGTKCSRFARLHLPFLSETWKCIFTNKRSCNKRNESIRLNYALAYIYIYHDKHHPLHDLPSNAGKGARDGIRTGTGLPSSSSTSASSTRGRGMTRMSTFGAAAHSELQSATVTTNTRAPRICTDENEIVSKGRGYLSLVRFYKPQ